MLVRRVARPLFAAWFVVEGLDAARHPEPHAERARATWELAADRLPLPPPPSPRQLGVLIRLHGAAMVGAAAMLATGRAPRTAAVVLAGLTLPLAVAHQPVTEALAAGSGHRLRDGRDALDRVLGADRFWRSLSMLGGAVLVAIDTEGRPGMVWRLEHARAARAAVRATASARPALDSPTG
ncbi:MAG TPA: DoxX family protein [Actinotalea sp.]|nr:DoxX family protein [Actinotalea sp.]